MTSSSPFAVVVNDDPTQLDVLCGLVRKAGIEPRAFLGAEAALADMAASPSTPDRAPGGRPALVVTDLHMPGLDGWRFCRLLRSPEYVALNTVPIIVVSATFAGDETDRIATDLGADAFLSAPVDGHRFVTHVQALLRGERPRTPPRVLIVEDSVDFARTLQKTFTEYGYQAETAITVRAAFDAFACAAYDVAVLDYRLPDGTGDTLLDLFRIQQPGCVYLMMTTDPGPELALGWMKRGAAAYLRKPFEPVYLIELCAKASRERALLRVQDLLDIRTRELRESEERLRTLFDHSPISIWEEDFSAVKTRFDALRADGVTDWHRYFADHPETVKACMASVRVLDVNQTSVEFFKGGTKAHLSRTLADYFTDASLQVFREELIALAEGRTSFESEIPIRNLEGHTQMLWLTLRVVPGKTDTLDRVLVSFADITERTRVEDALRDSLQRNRALVDANPDMLFVLSSDGTFVGGKSDRPGDLCAPPDRFIGKTVCDVLPPDIAQDTLVHMAEAQRTGQLVQYAYTMELNGESLDFESRLVPCENGMFVAVVRNITDRVRAEAEKTRLEAQLQQSLKMESVGRLAGGVAHDFNNMLGVILGHAEMAVGQVDPSQGLHADLMEIQKAAQRSADLTRQLLAFARQQTIAPRVLDVNDAVTGMLTMLRRLIGEDIRLCWQPDAQVGPVNMDPSQIDQILANLCVNARDAIGGVGTITIATSLCAFDANACAGRPGLQPGTYVRVTVHDTGRGMDHETLAHIFEPFFTTKAVGAGTGLGLATVYGIVKQNFGFIDVDSEPGHGTTFSVYLPHHVGTATQPHTASPQEQPRRGHETILLVEDEPAILSLTTRMLERQGYTVLAALTPGEAMRLAREHPGEIHLLMTDVVMPEMNGRDLAKNVLTIYPHVARLFMSGYTSDVIAHHGVLDHGVSFIQKPFSVAALAAKVRETLGGI